MTESRTVECQDCGYRWESSAADPRCSQSSCGRSRNVEPVEEIPDDEDDGSDEEPEQVEAEQVEADDGDSGSDGGFTPAFQTRQETTTEETTSDAPDLSSVGSDDEQDSEDSESEDAEASSGPDPAEDIPEIDPEQLEVAFDVTFDAIAARRGEHWKLDEDENEAQKLGKAWAPVANEYAPVIFREHTAVGVALVATVSVLMPRLARDRELAELREQQEREAENGTPGEERSPDPGGTVEAEQTDADEWVEQPADQSETDSAGGYANV